MNIESSPRFDYVTDCVKPELLTTCDFDDVVRIADSHKPRQLTWDGVRARQERSTRDGIRTHTALILNQLPLPLGYPGTKLLDVRNELRRRAVEKYRRFVVLADRNATVTFGVINDFDYYPFRAAAEYPVLINPILNWVGVI